MLTWFTSLQFIPISVTLLLELLFRNCCWMASCSHSYLCIAFILMALSAIPGPTNLLQFLRNRFLSAGRKETFNSKCVSGGKRWCEICGDVSVEIMWWLSWQYGKTRYCFLKENCENGTLEVLLIFFGLLLCFHSSSNSLRKLYHHYLRSQSCSAFYLSSAFNTTTKPLRLPKNI